MNLFYAFPYLTMSLILFALFLVGLALRPGDREPMLLSGLLQGPYALASILFVPDYWNPVRVAEGYLTGPEDVLFSVANGGLAWLLATWPIRDRLTLNPRLSRFLTAYAVCALSGLTLVLVCWRSGIPVMDAVLIAMVAVTAVLGLMQPRLWPIPVSGSVCFAVLYSVDSPRQLSNISRIRFTMEPLFSMGFDVPCTALGGVGMGIGLWSRVAVSLRIPC